MAITRNLENYNKLIDVSVSGDAEAESFAVVCPEQGRKPNITISGVLTTEDNLNDFQISFTNIYTRKIISNYVNHTLNVKAGYAKNKSTFVSGMISNAYTESPGPDRVSILQCTTANYSAWTETTCNVSYDTGTPITNIITALSSQLGFASPQITGITQTIAAPFEFNGLVKDAIHALRKYYPEIIIRIDNGRLIAYKQGTGTGLIYTIDYVTSSPQLSGGNVNFTAPWIPELRPGDFVYIPTSYFTMDMASQNISSAVKKWQVVTIQFEFSTVGDTNSMTVSAVTNEGAAA